MVLPTPEAISWKSGIERRLTALEERVTRSERRETALKYGVPDADQLQAMNDAAGVVIHHGPFLPTNRHDAWRR